MEKLSENNSTVGDKNVQEMERRVTDERREWIWHFCGAIPDCGKSVPEEKKDCWDKENVRTPTQREGGEGRDCPESGLRTMIDGGNNLQYQR